MSQGGFTWVLDGDDANYDAYLKARKKLLSESKRAVNFLDKQDRKDPSCNSLAYKAFKTLLLHMRNQTEQDLVLRSAWEEDLCLKDQATVLGLLRSLRAALSTIRKPFSHSADDFARRDNEIRRIFSDFDRRFFYVEFSAVLPNYEPSVYNRQSEVIGQAWRQVQPRPPPVQQRSQPFPSGLSLIQQQWAQSMGIPQLPQPRAPLVQQRPQPAQPTVTPVQQTPQPAQPRASPVQQRPQPTQPRVTPVRQRPQPAQSRPTPIQQRPQPAQPRAPPVQQGPQPMRKRPRPVQPSSPLAQQRQSPLVQETRRPVQEQNPPPSYNWVDWLWSLVGYEQPPASEDQLPNQDGASQIRTTRECSVCYEQVTEETLVHGRLTSECEHDETSVCRGCIAKHIEAQLGSKAWNALPCPLCPAKLDYPTVQKYASGETIERYDRLMINDTLALDSRFRRCLRPNCPNGQIHEAGDAEPLMTCDLCEYKTCYIHSRPWHEGQTCSEWDRLQREQEDRSTTLVERLSKPCPGLNCGIPIEKNDGCDHMTCSRCRHEFCYQCLAPYGPIRQRGNEGHERYCRYWPANLPAMGLLNPRGLFPHG